MTPAQRIAVECLGAVDALFLPLRDPHAKFWAPTWHLREHYYSHGLPYRGGRHHESERDLAAAVKGGLVVRRRGQARTVALYLTRHGLEECWSLLGYSRWCDVAIALEVERQALDLHDDRRGVVPEIAFSGGLGWGDGRTDQLHLIDATHLCALVSGLVGSNCSMRGNVGYWRTARRPPETPPDWEHIPVSPVDEEAEDCYFAAYKEGLHWLDSQTAETAGCRGYIGEIPLIHCTLGSWSAKHAPATAGPVPSTNGNGAHE